MGANDGNDIYRALSVGESFDQVTRSEQREEGFKYYSECLRERLEKQCPNIDSSSIEEKIGDMWLQLGPEGQAPFIEAAAEATAEQNKFKPPIRLKTKESPGEPYQACSKLQFPAAMYGDSGTFPFGKRLVSQTNRPKDAQLTSLIAANDEYLAHKNEKGWYKC